MNQLRQGDVWLERIDAIPADAEPEKGKGPCILAYGEATGHHHSVKRYGKLYAKAGERFLRVSRATTLEHQEHDPIALPRGTYRLIAQVEYTPEAIRNVAD